MINGDLEIFLDTGWFSEALLFLNGRAYWHEAQYDPETGQSHFLSMLGGQLTKTINTAMQF